MSTSRPLAVITGASSGFGAATAEHLAALGFDLVIGARRLDRLQQVAANITAAVPAAHVEVRELDVTVAASVQDFAADLAAVEVLVNNAGGALGVDSVETANLEQWQAMYDVNVLGVLRVTQALLPALRRGSAPVIVNIGSIAALEPYRGGAGYNAAKHALRALTRVLRLELKGEPIRISEIDPGMAETEFSLTRFDGDADKAAAVYAGVNALTATDIAETIGFIVTRPPHVNIDSLLLMPTDQVAAQDVYRRQ